MDWGQNHSAVVKDPPPFSLRAAEFSAGEVETDGLG